MEHYNKKHITQEMLKQAAKLWNIPLAESESSIDPLVVLLIKACAGELEKLHGKLHNMSSSITESLVELMEPDYGRSALPAHGIVQFSPKIEQGTLAPNQQLICNYNDFETKKSAKEFFFSSIDSYPLLNAKATYLISGNSLLKLNKPGRNEKIASTKKPVTPHSIYLGITTEQESLNLTKLPIYLKAHGNESHLFYHYLKTASWWLGDTQLKTTNGLSSQAKSVQKTIEKDYNANTTKMHNICNSVERAYQKNYITLEGPTLLVSSEKDASGKEKEPSYFKNKEIETLVNKSDLDTKENIFWIKVQFNSIVPESILENLFVSINAYPVINRKRHKDTYQMKDYLNVIPILTNNPFLDIASLENITGKEYYPQQIHEKSSNDTGLKGSYFIWDHGMGKLEKQKAKEQVTHLLDLLQDESAAFTFMNREFLKNNLTQLTKILTAMDQKLTNSEVLNGQTHYIQLNPYDSNEHLIVTYWTTSGDLANGIPTGAELTPYQDDYSLLKGGRFLNLVHGGTTKPSKKERLNRYRSKTLSGDRLVTKEDLKAFCYMHYGKTITNVTIQPGTTLQVDRNKGRIPCMEISITPSSQNTITEEAWEHLHEDLLYHLKQKALNILPYTIKQNKPNEK